MTQEPAKPRSPALENLTPKLRCTFEEVRAVQRAMTNGKLVHGTGSDGHSETVTSAESYGPALVADYLTLHAEITQMERIVNAATYLYDNRLGWSDGRSPYAHPSFWDELGRALGRDPAGFCGPTPPATPSAPEEAAVALRVVERAAAAILAADLGLPHGDMDLADAVTVLCQEVQAARAATPSTVSVPPELDEGAFQVGQRVTVIATRPHVHDTSDDEDADELCNQPGVVVEQLLNDPHHDYLVYVPHTRRVYACVPADLAELEPPTPQSRALRDVIQERARQTDQEDWTPEHDDRHTHGELAGAAACYVLTSVPDWTGRPPIGALWPWDRAWWKPTTRRRDLVKAGALILAEIERLDRLENPL